jgi:hypothetical protein
MRRFKIYYTKYDWSIEVFIIICKSDVDTILRSLEKIGGSDKVLDKAYDNLTDSAKNTGFTYTNSSRRKSVMVINKSTSMKEFINTYNHEKNHVEMHICEEFDIDPASEEAAYLSGELASQLYIPAICSFLF